MTIEQPIEQQSTDYHPIIIRSFVDMQDYLTTWQAMQVFTQNRTIDTPDEIWLLQHSAVYTQGQAGRDEHVLKTTSIPIIQSDRGGQVTYHGPGQLVAYILFDLQRHKLGIRSLVRQLELCIIQLLQYYGIESTNKTDAPGVYVQQQKIASIGLRVKRGCTYHGIAINVNMDLTPFSWINPCGFQGLEMTQLADFIPTISVQEVELKLIEILRKQFCSDSFGSDTKRLDNVQTPINNNE